MAKKAEIGEKRRRKTGVYEKVAEGQWKKEAEARAKAKEAEARASGVRAPVDDARVREREWEANKPPAARKVAERKPGESVVAYTQRLGAERRAARATKAKPKDPFESKRSYHEQLRARGVKDPDKHIREESQRSVDSAKRMDAAKERKLAAHAAAVNKKQSPLKQWAAADKPKKRWAEGRTPGERAELIKHRRKVQTKRAEARQRGELYKRIGLGPGASKK